uniref:Calpain catalytic domain-containing protein n=1 Tax=Denticeps clupeoides TaxID=299321 RepID=A0AAY4C7X6_9TELE
MPLPGVCRAVLNERRKSGDPGSPANPDTFLEQSFRELHRECLSRRARFVDDAFPPDTRSIGPGLLQPERLADVVWLRPRQIVPDPYFILNGMSRFDIIQGELGNCWFLAAIGALTFQKSTREQIIPTEQSFQVDYAGIFHFRFWRFGKWVDVVIDDLLPTIDGHLIFVQSKTPNEFWAALMEKAYAKVCGSYADMNAGNISEALMDFTGRAHITYQLQPPPPELWDLMYRAAESGSLMGCGTPPGRGNAVQPNGIVEGHAYTVTGVAEIMSSGNPVKLVRLLNPWGHGEWRGDWSDKSPKWRTVSPEDRMSFLSIDDNGEFWMSVDDFCQNYATVDICGLWPGFFYGSSKCHWMSCDGRWVAGTTAGGCINHTESFWTNPQFRITLVGTGAQVADNSHTVFVSLMQKPDKRHRHLCSYHYIGFSIFMVCQYLSFWTQGKFPAPFFSRKNLVAHTQNYLNSREVTEFFRLSQGEYIIVPSTFKPGESASFLLTVFSKFEICPTSGVHLCTPYFMFCLLLGKFEEVDAEQLQRLLNENIVQGALRGFSLDSCRSIVALMDLSVTGHLNADEFRRLWLRVVAYRDIFYRNDSSKDGLLSLSELRSAVMAAGIQVSDGFLSIMALRYGDPTGRLSLESFITLILRMECMSSKLVLVCLNLGMHLPGLLQWMHLTMYS